MKINSEAHPFVTAAECTRSGSNAAPIVKTLARMVGVKPRSRSIAAHADEDRKLRIIVRVVADFTGFAFDDLVRPGRAPLQRLTHAQYIAMWIADRTTAAGAKRIGAFFGKHHGVVSHARVSIDDERDVYVEVKCETDELLRRCQEAIDRGAPPASGGATGGGWPLEEARDVIAGELAEMVITADRVAQFLGIDLGAAVITKSKRKCPVF